jgi:pimeloyl-ACP methyl ester carboxylesterase
MWGASEAFANGTMKNWDIIARLHEITEPVLITSGQYDELTPEQALITNKNIAGSKIKIFTAGSHCTHVEHEAEYLKTVEDFLGSI